MNDNWTKWVQAKIMVWEHEPRDQVDYCLVGNDVTDQLAYAHSPRSPIVFFNEEDEAHLGNFIERCN